MDKTQGINFTLYQRHIDIIDAKARDYPRHNRSRALQDILDEYTRTQRCIGRPRQQPPAGSDRGGDAGEEK